MSELAFRPAVELAAAIHRRELGSRELLDHYLERVERLDPGLNAVVTLDAERARARADEADEALARGESWGPLHGLPLTVKDVFETEGLRTTCGTAVWDHVPERDAVAVARLKAAGAVLFGKTNTPAFAGDVQTYNDLFGTTVNPWDAERSPGGSSGGSAAALAAGLTPLELGSDIGGSIRIPAHWCGVFGHKPSYGIVPTRGHLPGPPGTLSTADVGVVGPLARSADDLELALGVVAGQHGDRAAAWRLELPPPRAGRIAAWLDDLACPVDVEARDVLEAAAEAAGAEEARPALRLDEMRRLYNRLMAPLFSLDDLVEVDDPLALASHRDWLIANEERERLRVVWGDFFERYDALLCPVFSVPAIRHDHSEPSDARTIEVNGVATRYWANSAWIYAVGLAYLPATVAPVGRTAAGLPVGIQIVGPYGGDRTTIELARRIGRFEIPPGFAA